MKGFLILASILIFGISFWLEDASAQYMQPKDADVDYFYDEKENWNTVTNSQSGFTLTLETNQVQDYSEIEYIRIKSKMVYTGFESMEIPVSSSCPTHHYLKLIAKGNSESYKIHHDSDFKKSKIEGNRMCLPAESLYSFGFLETIERDIYWKHGLEPGNYTLTSSWFDFVSASIPIRILESNSSFLQQSIDNESESVPKLIEPGEVEFQNPMRYLGEPYLGNVESFCKHRTSIQFPNLIEGGKIKQICLDSDIPSIIVEFNAFTNGWITLEIPRIALDHNNSDCTDRRFFVLLNGEEVDYDEEKNEKFRIITVPITSKDYRMEVIASVIMVNTSPNLDKCQKLIQDKFRPLEQIRYGITPREIVCKDGLELIFKIDNSPACIKSESIPKLIERGWAKPPLSKVKLMQMTSIVF